MTNPFRPVRSGQAVTGTATRQAPAAMTMIQARLAPAIPTLTRFQLGKPATSKRQPTRVKDRDNRIIMLVSSKAANNRAAKTLATKLRKPLVATLLVAPLLTPVLSANNLTFFEKGLAKVKMGVIILVNQKEMQTTTA